MCKIYCRTKADIGPVVVMMMMVMIMVMAVVMRVMMMMVVMVMMTKQLTDATVEPRLKSPGDKLQLGEPAQQQPPHNEDEENQLFFQTFYVLKCKSMS